jgi:hypothetical protein
VFDKKQHYENSSLRENIIEHMFVGLALKALWYRGKTNVEILRSEFDAYGYDLVISAGNIIRHVQLKSGIALKKVSVSTLLAEKPSGCVLFIQIDDALEMKSFWLFASDAREPLPSLDNFPTTKRTTHNVLGEKPDRTMHREIPKAKFKQYDKLESVLSRLLGESESVLK